MKPYQELATIVFGVILAYTLLVASLYQGWLGLVAVWKWITG